MCILISDMSIGNQVTPLIESNSGLGINSDSQELRHNSNKLNRNDNER